MSIRIRESVSALCAAALGWGSLSAQRDPGQVTAAPIELAVAERLVDSATAQPLRRGYACISDWPRDPSSPNVSWCDYSDSTGHFVLHEVGPGDHLLTVSCSDTSGQASRQLVSIRVRPVADASFVRTIPVSAGGCDQRPFAVTRGVFEGYYWRGFEQSSFRSCSNAGGGDSWVAFSEAAWERLLAASPPSSRGSSDRLVKVRWRATVIGPGRYCHMGYRKYLMTVYEVLSAHPADSIDCGDHRAPARPDAAPGEASYRLLLIDKATPAPIRRGYACPSARPAVQHGRIMGLCASTDSLGAVALQLPKSGPRTISIGCAMAAAEPTVRFDTTRIVAADGDTAVHSFALSFAGCDQRPFTVVRGLFDGYLETGFERSSFQPCGGTPTPETWVEFANPEDYRRVLGEMSEVYPKYRVRWYAHVVGPRRYGALGQADYLMTVDNVITIHEPSPGDCGAEPPRR